LTSFYTRNLILRKEATTFIINANPNEDKMKRTYHPSSIRIKLSDLISVLILFMIAGFTNAPAQGQGPVTPNASPEAKALLKYLQSISGKHILSGQHNFPSTGERNTMFAAQYIGETPVVWSQDFGFAAEGDKDSYLSRPLIIEEAIRQHRRGAIITLCWHAVPPTADEPVTFQPVPGRDPALPLASVQGKLTDEQFRDIITPGTALNKKWEEQVDVIASCLKQLQDAGVPVLWRPYHEMNGDWFWWGGRYEGKYTTVALYKQLFDRLVRVHKLNNLIWVWSVDRPSQPGREFVKYYPATKYLDILAIDIYGNDFNQTYYNGLLSLSEGKPVTLGEVGNPPSTGVIGKQPGWIYWVVWAGMVRGTTVSDYEKLVSDNRVLFMEDPAYTGGTKEYRNACGFGPVMINTAVNFTGEWKFNECESNTSGSTGTPYKLSIIQQNNILNTRSYTISEYSDDDITVQTMILDGSDNLSKGFMNSQRVQNATWNTRRDTLNIDSKVTINYGGRTNEIKSKEVWSIRNKGNKLVISQTSPGFPGSSPRTSNLVYDRQ
jgi:mannan endo-1,4-beta-mannosidase